MAGTVEHFDGAVVFVDITWETALSLAGIGFAGGLLSGFLGTGGAFIMTPAMMSLGIPGIMAVAANITHKFGKAIVGAKKHNEMGNVDKKLGFFMFFALFAGVNAAVSVNKKILLKSGAAGSDLYISLMFIFILSAVSIFMLRDVIRKKNAGMSIESASSNAGVTEKPGKTGLPPFIHFKVAGVRASLWTVLMVGLATGYLAGTIGVGGFIGVPAMVYLLGVSMRVAAGTELFLAVFSGLQGAFLYALNGFVDLRIPLLLYIGSLVGVTLGATVTRAVKTSQIQTVMISIMAMVVVSRAWTVPGYLAEMGYLQAGARYLPAFKTASDIFLFGSGAVGCGMILWWMFGAVAEKRRAATRQ